MDFILSKIVGIPFIQRPFQKLEEPEYYGVGNATNLRIPVQEGQELGAWFMRPKVKENLPSSKERWNFISSSQAISKYSENDEGASNGQRIYFTEADETAILYLHGNAETRSHGHRRGLYKKLLKLGFVVLAPDYRGYADSYGGFSFKASQNTMAMDAEKSFEFLKKHAHPNSKIIVWGHSLGTGITTTLAYNLKESNERPHAYVLESPFSSMEDEVGTFQAAKGLKLVMDVNKLIKDSDLTFDSTAFISHIKEPIAILHAKGDWVVPYKLGEKLYTTALNNSCNVRFFDFEYHLGLGHENIYKAESFDDILKQIMLMLKNC